MDFLACGSATVEPAPGLQNPCKRMLVMCLYAPLVAVSVCLHGAGCSGYVICSLSSSGNIAHNAL